MVGDGQAADTYAGAGAGTLPPPAPGAGAGQALSPGTHSMSASATEFVPSFLRTDSDIKSQLPGEHRAMLRQVYQAMTGEIVAYYVGRLKTFNSRTGYGFVECEQTTKDFGADVFIHKNLVPNPWHIGQPVEFAVSVNNRGQPQARDVQWLPPLQAGGGPGAPMAQALGGAPGAGGGYGSGSFMPGMPGMPGAAAGADAARSSSAAPWGGQAQEFLGSVKSFSPIQGYGFLSHDDMAADVYFDRTSLTPGDEVKTGQYVSYCVKVNARGQHQGKHINWDPVPLCSPSAPDPSRRYPPETLAKLRKLLYYRHTDEIEKMVIMGIDNQKMGPGQQDGNEVDFATFTFDRLGDHPPMPGVIKDFVKMLLLLMLAKMMKNQLQKARCQKLVNWFTVLSREIDPLGDEVKDHIAGVVDQASSDLKIAMRENPHIREATELMPAFQQLQAQVQRPAP